MKKLLWFTPLALAVLALNASLTMRYAGSRHAWVESLAAESVHGPVRLDLNRTEERYYQAVRAELAPAPEVLILGSSRSRQVGAGSFPGRRVYTAAVDGGGLADMAAILRAYEVHRKMPRLLVLGLDHFHLDNPESGYWREIEGHYRGWLDSVNLPLPAADWPLILEFRLWRVVALASPYSTRQGLLRLMRGPEASIVWKDADGTRDPPSEPRRNRSRILAREVAQFTSRVPPGWLPAPRPSPIRIRTIEAMLETGRRSGGEVLVWLAPLHPDTYRVIQRQTGEGLKAAETLIRRLARERGVPVVGSYSPAACGARETDFEDAVHPGTELVERIFRDAAGKR